MRPIKRTPAMLAAMLTSCIFIGLGAVSAQAREIGSYTTKGAWSFYSETNLHPPKLSTDKPVRGKLATGGYFITANFYNLNSPTPMIGQSGPLILNNKLQPVWFHPVPENVIANNLEVQQYEGQPALTWWQGVVTAAGSTVSGEYVVYNQDYRLLTTLKGKDGWVLSLHDLRISGQDAWVTAYKDVRDQNLTKFGGKANGTVLDVAVQEYDLKTGKLIYTWDALNPGGKPNVPLTQSKSRPYGNVPWDAYHINSIQLVGNEEFLVSLRNTWGVYLVNSGDNQIVWTLSGNPSISTFKLPAEARFHWQHDVELLPNNEVTIFDDACCNETGVGTFGSPSGPSRGLVLQLNVAKHTGSFVAQYIRGKSFNSYFLGSTELLPNGNALVGWGAQPYFTEFSKSGQTLLDVKWPLPDQSYRVLFDKWVGTPYFPPDGAVRKSNGKTTVYASWDGATKAVAWRVLAGSSKTSLKQVVKSAAKTNFETAISVSGSYSWFEVQALDSSGKVLGSSKPFGGGSLAGLLGAY